MYGGAKGCAFPVCCSGQLQRAPECAEACRTIQPQCCCWHACVSSCATHLPELRQAAVCPALQHCLARLQRHLVEGLQQRPLRRQAVVPSHQQRRQPVTQQLQCPVVEPSPQGVEPIRYEKGGSHSHRVSGQVAEGNSISEQGDMWDTLCWCSTGLNTLLQCTVSNCGDGQVS